MPEINTAVTIAYMAWNTSSLTGETGDAGNHTLRGTADGVEFTPAASPSEIDATNWPGMYKVVIASDENTGVMMALGGKSSTSDVVIIPVQWTNSQIDASALNTLSGHDPGSTIAAQSDITGLNDPSAADIWSYTSRTLTQAADSLEEITSGSLIVRKRGDYWSISRTGVGSLAGRTACYFTVKESPGKTDAEALLKIEETAGLQVFDGDDDVTATDASLTIDDETLGNYTVVVKVVLTAEIDPDTYVFDLQPVFANGPTTMEEGQFKVTSDITRATS